MKDKNEGITYIIERDNSEDKGETICIEIMPNSFPELM